MIQQVPFSQFVLKCIIKQRNGDLVSIVPVCVCPKVKEISLLSGSIE